MASRHNFFSRLQTSLILCGLTSRIKDRIRNRINEELIRRDRALIKIGNKFRWHVSNKRRKLRSKVSAGITVFSPIERVIQEACRRYGEFTEFGMDSFLNVGQPAEDTADPDEFDPPCGSNHHSRLYGMLDIKNELPEKDDLIMLDDDEPPLAPSASLEQFLAQNTEIPPATVTVASTISAPIQTTPSPGSQFGAKFVPRLVALRSIVDRIQDLENHTLRLEAKLDLLIQQTVCASAWKTCQDTRTAQLKGVAYRFPFSGKIYYDRDNLTITYGHNINQIDPFNSLFDYPKHRDPRIAIPRDLPWKPNVPTRAKRQVQVEVINNESNSVPVHPESAAKGQIDAIVRHLQDPPPNVEAHPRVKPLAVAPPGPAPIPLPPDTSTNVQPFYPIGPPPNPEEVLRKLNPQIFLKDHEANNQEIVRQLMAINQQPVQPILDPYLKLRVERPNLLQQVLERQVQQNALLEGQAKLHQQLRQPQPRPLESGKRCQLAQYPSRVSLPLSSHFYRFNPSCHASSFDLMDTSRARQETRLHTGEDCARPARSKAVASAAPRACATWSPIAQHEAPAPTSATNKFGPVIVFIYLATVSLIGAMIFNA
ncbi:unnamed protein product, partial [Mesorhabditis spiculigera]